MKKLKLTFASFDGVDVEELFYTDTHMEISVLEDAYSPEILVWNPQLVGETTTYMSVRLKEIPESTKQELLTKLKYVDKNIKLLDSKGSEAEIRFRVMQFYYRNYLYVFERLGLLTFRVKISKENPVVPNSGTPYYLNATGWRAFYNAAQMLALYLKRKVFCRKHTFVYLSGNGEHCSKCGIDDELNWLP